MGAQVRARGRAGGWAETRVGVGGGVEGLRAACHSPTPLCLKLLPTTTYHTPPPIAHPHHPTHQHRLITHPTR